MCPLISQIFVTGRQTESYLVAIIVPVMKKLEELVNQSGEISFTTDFIHEKQIENIVIDYLRQHGKLNDLNELEQIRRVYIELEEFTPDNNLLTPTLKMKRNLLLKKYQTIIDDMYRVSL
jgi:long-chain acyl-CoA synthetase